MKQMTPIQPTPYFPPGALDGALDAMKDVRRRAAIPRQPSAFPDVVSYAMDMPYESIPPVGDDPAVADPMSRKEHDHGWSIRR